MRKVAPEITRAIATEYKAWLRVNPGRDEETRMKVFDRIADKHLTKKKRIRVQSPSVTHR